MTRLDLFPNDSGNVWHRLEVVPRLLLGGIWERHVARKASLESLQMFRELEAEQPDLDGMQRYKTFIARRTGLDGAGVSRVMERAEDSFASWPIERPLRFRDVVQYLVVYECLKADPSSLGTRSELTSVIAEVIPDNL